MAKGGHYSAWVEIVYVDMSGKGCRGYDVKIERFKLRIFEDPTADEQ